MFSVNSKTIDWLMEGDPAIRWQVQRYLLGERPSVYEKERAKVATEGWGARYLSFQDKNGTWGKGLYSPKWISTHYTLYTLRFLGLPPKHPAVLKACRRLLEGGFLADHGITYAGSKPVKDRNHAHAETCITGMSLAMFSYFQFEDGRVDQIAEHLLGRQMADYGWNCRSYRGDKHASFNTTLLVLEGLREYQQFRPKNKLPIKAVMENGREFLLRHHLFRSHHTGAIAHSVFTVMIPQPNWRYDFLSALDHFQASRAARDKRLQDAIDLLLSKRSEDDRWPLERKASGKLHFTMEPPSKPSRWNSLRALRVLTWWEANNFLTADC